MLVWLAWLVMAFDPSNPWTLASLVAPLVMYLLLTRVSGAYARLARGNPGQYLGVSGGGALQWQTPSSLSHTVITDLLRGELGFRGLIMTDDLDMGAILNEVTFEQAIQEAVRAGNDLVMICHRLEMVELARQHLDGVENPVLHDALMRIEKTKKRLVKPDAFSLTRFGEINQEIWNLRVATLGEERAKQLSVEDGKRSPVELY